MITEATRWREKLRRCFGEIHRELRISFTTDTRPDKWLFIVGCYNSGTQLLMRLLGTHPEISSLPQEGQFLTDQFPSDYELGLPRMWVQREDLFRLTEDDGGPDQVRLRREWLMRLDRSRSVFLEKSPPNMARTRWLQAHFHNAHFLAVVRNGYAVSEGIRRKAEPRHLADGWPLERCAHQWARSNEVLLADAEHLRNIHWLRYEDFVSKPEEATAELLNFLDLEVGGSVDIGGRWSVHERNQPIRNMNPESIERLTSGEVDQITSVAGSMLEYFGYETL